MLLNIYTAYPQGTGTSCAGLYDVKWTN